MARNKKGQFEPGFDKDRHVFTRMECQKGFWVTMTYKKGKIPSRVIAHVRNKIRGYYINRRRTKKGKSA
jgi:hypothetical protein